MGVTGRHVVLVGMMGSGKTHGRPAGGPPASARRFVDLDAELEAGAGRAVRQIFAERGRGRVPASRDGGCWPSCSRRAEPPVIGTGGGVVLAEANRRLLRRRRPPSCGWRRRPDVARRPGRARPGPAAAGRRRPRCRRCAGCWASGRRLPPGRADHVVDAGRGLPEQVAERVAAWRWRGDGARPEVERIAGRPRRAQLPRAGRPRGPPPPGATCCRRTPGGSRSSSQAGIPVERRPRAVEHRVFLLGEGEAAKTLATVEELCRRWASWGLTRADVRGGGRRWRGDRRRRLRRRRLPPRASRWCTCPPPCSARSTRPSAARPGSTCPRARTSSAPSGSPAAVLCDTDTLASLPEREYRSGLGELAKYHFLGGADLDGWPCPHGWPARWRIKAAVVAGDEREGGGAGHVSTTATPSPTPSRSPAPSTCATARRWPSVSSSPPSWPRASGGIDAERVAEHRRVVAGLRAARPAAAGRRTRPARASSWAGTRRRRGGLTFVLDGPGGVEPVTGVDAQPCDRPGLRRRLRRRQRAATGP